MNKKTLSLLFLGGLVLSACAEAKPVIIQYVEDAKHFTLVSPTEPVVLVHDKVKQYTDAMYKQRDDDNGKDEDKILDPVHADTVKIKKYWGNYDVSVPVELSFTVDDEIKDNDFKVKYWVEGHENEAKEVDAVDGKVSIKNLYRGSSYEWCVLCSNGIKSATKYFDTADYARIITIGDLYNVRDLGGWTTLDGKRIKQGLFYRGCEINTKRTDGHKKNVTDEGKKDFKDLGIKLELDLRTDKQSGGITECGFDNTVEYKRITTEIYHLALNTESEDFSGPNFKTIFEDYLTNVNKMPMYCHCYGGSDRVGTLTFLLDAILGMSYTDLIVDYEISSFSGVEKEHDVSSDYTYWPEMIAEIKSWSFYSPEKTLKEVIETYLTTVCGVNPNAIKKIREIFLEDIPKD